MKKNIDWKAVQVYYDSNRTISEVCDYFSISPSGVAKARLRGDFKTRNKSECQTKGISCERSRLEEIAVRYDNGESGRDLIKNGFRRKEITEAKKLSLFYPRSFSDALKNKVKQKGQSKMSPEARKRLSEEQSLRNRGGKCKWFEVSNKKVQGTWERDLALKFEDFGLKWIKPATNNDIWLYEKDGKIRSYSPDFYLSEFDTYIELKGFWWGDDKEKMDIIKKLYPERKLLIVEKDEYNICLSLCP